MIEPKRERSPHLSREKKLEKPRENLDSRRKSGGAPLIS
jgi:hypothetical protein